VPPPVTAVERGLADLWHRSAPGMQPAARHQLRGDVIEMLESWLWELVNHQLNRIPDPVDYVEMRRATFGSNLTMSLYRLTLGDQLPPALLETRTMTGLAHSAQDFGGLLNDLCSYQKEIQFEGELHNGVLVVESFLMCGMHEAAAIVGRLMAARVEQFQHVVATELPTVAADFALDTTARAQLMAYVASLEHWMSGVHHWHRETRRYDEASLRAAPSLGRVLHARPGPAALRPPIPSRRGAS
jgi:germacradienol/geosmin synthase